jgi:nucleoid DNA-binding protein
MAKAKASAPKRSMTKSQLLNAISDQTDLTRKDVGAVLDALETQISKSLGRRGPGMFTLPGLVKIEKKAARPGEDREEAGPGPQGPQERPQPVQAG